MVVSVVLLAAIACSIPSCYKSWSNSAKHVSCCDSKGVIILKVVMKNDPPKTTYAARCTDARTASDVNL